MKRRVLAECLSIAVSRVRAGKHPRIKTWRHFTFIVQNNRIMGFGTNRFAEPAPPGYPKYSIMHSERDAYFGVRFNKDEIWDVVNIRLGLRLTPLLSKPCPCCASFLLGLGCRKIYFSTPDGFERFN